MTTRIYANNVKATALANIISDAGGYISFNADGVKVVDTAGLKAYLIAQLELISTTPEYIAPASASSSLAAARAVSVDNLVQQLVDAIGVNHWNTRADWPTSTDVLSGAALVNAVNAGIAECKRAAAAVTSYYADVNTRLQDFVTQFYYGQGIDALVTPAVVRIIETRAVIYTHVTDKGEESAPSPASALVELDQNDTATYTANTIPTGRNISLIRWYRSRSSNVGADFAFVAETAYTTLAYTDSKKAEELQEPCPSITWSEPPATLAGLTEGPNGGMAGFTGNTFHPCENFVPYAWPAAYQKTTAWPIVGIGKFGNTYVTLTRGKPYFMTGADSASLDSQPIDSNQSCVSRRSIVNVEGGVVYASPDGLCIASSAGVKLITEGHFTRENWQALVPSSIFATEHEGAYIFHYDTGSVTGCYSLDLKTGKLGTINATGSAFFRDLLADTLYMASGTTIKSLFTAGTKRTGTWKSKKAMSESNQNYGWLQVDSDYESPVTVKLYRDGVLTDTKTVTSIAPVRLSAKIAMQHEVQVESAAKVTSLTITNSTAELRAL
jgi:hypothetical protein